MSLSRVSGFVRGLSLVLCVCLVAVQGCKTTETAEVVGDVPPMPGEPAAPADPSIAPANLAPVEPAAAVAAPSSGDYVVSVNGKELSRKEINETMDRELSSRAASGMPAAQIEMMKERMEEQIVRGFVEKNVLMDEAVKRGYSTTEAELKEEIGRITASVPPGETVDSMLEQNGMTMGDLEKNVSDRMAIKKLIDEVVAGVPAATDDEVKAFYQAKSEQVKARHVLISFDPADDQAAKDAKKAKAEAIREKLVGGADFAAVAKESSDCPSKERGGDLGEFGRGMMVKSFEDAAFTQKIGEIGPVIESDFGYHVIEVTARTPGSLEGYEDAAEATKRMVDDDKKEKVIMDTLKELEAKAAISYGK